MSIPRFVLSQVASLALASFVGAGSGEEPTLEERLERLAESLEAARETGHIPGMSIAIVKDDEIVWARGFGLADLESERPADENTIYAVGSTTKSFTATLVGMLVDEKKADWDDPVTDYLPYFDLAVKSEDPNAACTLRDLLSHRHGFARMGILWFGGQATRKEILTTASNAEPWDDFRAGFHYCNVTYLAAGEAAGVAAKSSWDELMVERIFEPLKMSSSTLRASEALEDARLAIGYSYEESDDSFDAEHMVDLEPIGPAGSVNSNVLDMAQWVRLQLGRGEVDEMRLISEQRLLETWEPQISMGGNAAYGMGWMLQEHDGRKVVEHGGNIGGFSAQIGMIPEENLGYVLLMNLSVSPLQQGSLGMVFDALLDEWPAEEEPAVAEAGAEVEVDFADYTGTYVANFATFRGEEFEVLDQGENLALNIPSQMTFPLKNPDDEGRWVFALTDQIAVTFQRGDEGNVIGLTMHQNGYAFEVPRKDVESAPEVPLEDLAKYEGTYVLAEGDKRIKIAILQGRLTIEDKGNLLAFHAPDAKGHAALRARADQGATFHEDAEGHVDSLTFHGNAGDRLFTRLAEADDPELPSLDQLLDLRKTEARVVAIEAADGTRANGKIWVAQSGVSGTVTIYTQGGDHFASHTDFGKFGRIDLACRGAEAWSYDSIRKLKELKGDQLQQTLLAHPAAVEGDWREYYDDVQVVRNDTLRERPVHVLRLRKGGLPSSTFWVDAETGDVLQVNQVTIEGKVRIPVTVNYYDFEERDGLRYASRVESENPASGKTVMTFEGYESGLELPAETFVLTAPASDGDTEGQ